MKHLLVAALFIALAYTLSSCQQTAVQAEQGIVAGDYRISGTASYSIEGSVSSEPISGTLTVYKAKEGDYFFSERTGLGKLNIQIIEQALNFTIVPATDYTKVGATTYYGTIDKGCVGTAKGGTINYDRYANTQTAGVTSPEGEQINYYKKIRKHVHVVAVKGI